MHIVDQREWADSRLRDDDGIDDLVDRYERHLLVVTGRPAAEGAERQALTALATSTAILDALAVERWPLVRIALARGAALTEVGAALGNLEPDEVAAGLTSWADRRARSGPLGAAEHGAVLELLARTSP